MRKDKVLVIAPHMDDEILGCGGVIAKHAAKKDSVFVCFIANRVYGHKFDAGANELEKKHALEAGKVLHYRDAVFFGLDDERLDASVQDIVIPLERYIKKVRPDIVYCPFRGDNHQDHRAVFDAARIAVRPSATLFIRRLLAYEVPSSTEQSPPLAENAFMPNYYEDISRYINTKIRALRCYKTESRLYPHPRSEESIKILAQKRGIESGFKYAEAFMLLRERAA